MPVHSSARMLAPMSALSHIIRHDTPTAKALWVPVILSDIRSSSGLQQAGPQHEGAALPCALEGIVFTDCSILFLFCIALPVHNSTRTLAPCQLCSTFFATGRLQQVGLCVPAILSDSDHFRAYNRPIREHSLVRHKYSHQPWISFSFTRSWDQRCGAWSRVPAWCSGNASRVRACQSAATDRPPTAAGTPDLA